MANPDGSGLTPRAGTYLIGVVDVLVAMLAIVTVKYIGRRPLVIWGHLSIAVIHFMIGWFNNNGNNTGVLVGMLVFLLAYQNTSGPVAWMYAAETNIDAALGISLFTLWGTVFVLSLVCPILMSKPADGGIGPSNVFFIFAGLSVLGALYGYIFIKETKGLSDKEKKLLFTPERFKPKEEEKSKSLISNDSLIE